MELEAENPHYVTDSYTYLGKLFIYHEIQTTGLLAHIVICVIYAFLLR